MPDPSAPIPTIRKLTIARFRGIEHLEWQPASGVNVVLGGGDVGESTVLDAVALLFNPTNSTLLSDADYFNRETADGFEIEAVVSLPPTSEINHQKHMACPWEWDGTFAQIPDLANPRKGAIPVYRLRVAGSADLELSYEIVETDNTTRPLGVAVRRAIGLVRLSGDDRNDRDLRLVQGSALDRLIGDKQLRSRIARQLGQTQDLIELQPEAQERLKDLNTALVGSGLPSDLSLGVTGGAGISINALIGVTADKNGVHLPLTSWGSGTRRLASLAIAAANQAAPPIVVVDEVERGLEPYRQRLLMSEILKRESQVFVTTHSPARRSCPGTAKSRTVGLQRSTATAFSDCGRSPQRVGSAGQRCTRGSRNGCSLRRYDTERAWSHGGRRRSLLSKARTFEEHQRMKFVSWSGCLRRRGRSNNDGAQGYARKCDQP